MKGTFAGIVLVFFLSPVLIQCDVSSNRPGEQAVIPESSRVVTFSCVTWSDVKFNHEQHSARFNGMCIKCHDHQTIAGQTHWYCRSCHTAGSDVEKLCDPVEQHGCIMTQCHNCHETKGENPGLSCEGCHAGGMKTSGGGNTIPAATITAPSPSAVTVLRGESVNFSGSVSSGDTPFVYMWDFGGGAGNQTVLNPGAVTFATTGVYTVVFRVTDQNGDSSSDSVVVTVNDTGGGTKPVISFNNPLSGSIVSSSEVDHIVMSITKAGRIVIDVDAWEGCGNKVTIPTDLFSDGASNNKLKANMYLFNQAGTCVGSSTGSYPSCDDDGDCAPGGHSTRTGQSPYLSMDINPGTYIIAIGSYPLSQSDAWAKSNTGGSSWSDYDDFRQVALFNKYRLKISFQQQ
ncbi:MAG: DVUA0089 family protein [Desulfobacterota bacterium]|jgi:hypothetical protein|nr:DVUA0089 family protein [Thermodesulfobacteriota bacterium]